MNPFLIMVERELTGITILQKKTCTAVYADDVSIYIDSKEDIKNQKEMIRISEEATGAEINCSKSKALLLGSWDTNINIMNISYTNEIKILGIRFSNTIKKHERELRTHPQQCEKNCAKNT
jgi:hypothetical protein